jgi:hypothetical protein
MQRVTAAGAWTNVSTLIFDGTYYTRCPVQGHVFSRKGIDATAAEAAALAQLRAAADPASLPLIVDAEIVAVADAAAAGGGGGGAGGNGDGEEGGGSGGEEGGGTVLLSFQELAARPRGAKGGGGAGGDGGAPAGAGAGARVCVYVFDALCVGGAPLLDRPLRARRAALAAALPGMRPGVVELAASIEVPRAAPAAAAAGGAASAPQQQAKRQQQQEEAAAPAGEELGGGSGGEKGSEWEAGEEAASSGEASGGEDEDGGSGGAAEGGGGKAAAAAAVAPQHAARARRGAAASVEDDDEEVPDDEAEAAAEVFRFFQVALRRGAEGLMLKRLDGAASAYAPAKRCDAWVKLKVGRGGAGFPAGGTGP